MDNDDRPFLPWGSVTPEFWVVPGAELADAPAIQRQPAQDGMPSQPEVPPAPAPNHEAKDAAAASPRTEAPARSEEQHQAGDVAAAMSPPEEYRSRIAAITSAFGTPQDRTRLVTVITDAEELDQEITARYGAEHPFTVNVRELRGWLAHLLGDNATATNWYLHTTGLQISIWGPDHQVTKESAGRAVYAWSQITARHEALALGPELLTMLATVTGEDSQLSGQVHSRLEKLRGLQ